MLTLITLKRWAWFIAGAFGLVLLTYLKGIGIGRRWEERKVNRQINAKLERHIAIQERQKNEAADRATGPSDLAKRVRGGKAFAAQP